MVSIPLPTRFSPVEVQQTLFRDHKIEVPLMTWKEKTLIRVSVQGYNDMDDLSKLVDAVKEIYR